MAFLLDLRAKLETRANHASYRKAHRTAATTALLTQLALGNNAVQNTKHIQHPLHESRLKEYLKEAEDLPSGKPLTLNFGDSLTDLSRKYLKDSMDAVWSISGSWHYHMADMAEAMKLAVAKYNVGYIAVGCLGGNPLLVYQDLQKTIEASNAALNKIRSLYPDAKIIVYGLPPTYNINLLEATYPFDTALVQWVEKDGNAVFISLKNFGSFFGFFPSCSWSSDGVHLTPNAARRLSRAVNKAKTSPAGLVIFA